MHGPAARRRARAMPLLRFALAQPRSAHPLLRWVALDAARRKRFAPVIAILRWSAIRVAGRGAIGVAGWRTIRVLRRSAVRISRSISRCDAARRTAVGRRAALLRVAAALLQFLFVQHGFAQALRVEAAGRARPVEFAFLRRPEIMPRSRRFAVILPASAICISRRRRPVIQFASRSALPCNVGSLSRRPANNGAIRPPDTGDLRRCQIGQYEQAWRQNRKQDTNIHGTLS